MSDKPDVPTLYDWMGGSDAIERLMTRFYERVPQDELLGLVQARALALQRSGREGDPAWCRVHASLREGTAVVASFDDDHRA